MTLAEFKAWFDGYLDAWEAAWDEGNEAASLTEADIKIIKEKLAAAVEENAGIKAAKLSAIAKGHLHDRLD